MEKCSNVSAFAIYSYLFMATKLVFMDLLARYDLTINKQAGYSIIITPQVITHISSCQTIKLGKKYKCTLCL